MSKSAAGRSSGTNLLLDSLPEKEYRRLRPALEVVPLVSQQTLFRAGESIRYAYFPTAGVVSLAVIMRDGGSVETGLAGREGVVSLDALVGNGAPHEAVVQCPGEAVRLKAEAFRAEVRRGGALADMLRHYTATFLAMLTQSAACNRLHAVKPRLCRWLLLTRDRLESDQFGLTHDFLARMLGVRREAVTRAARNVQQAGLIRYGRGRMETLDCPGLEAASCECYRTIRTRFDRMLADIRASGSGFGPRR